MSLKPSELIPARVIPPGVLPPLRQRELPPPVPLAQMIGPSIILAGLALGSGEFILWPYITFRSQFVFFWACLLAVVMQYFLNLEIMRWTLATGESAMTGIIRLWRRLAGLFLVLNIVPWMIPAWANGAAEILGWLIGEPRFRRGEDPRRSVRHWICDRRPSCSAARSSPPAPSSMTRSSKCSSCSSG